MMLITKLQILSQRVSIALFKNGIPGVTLKLTLRLLKNWLTKFISQVLLPCFITWFQQIQIQRIQPFHLLLWLITSTIALVRRVNRWLTLSVITQLKFTMIRRIQIGKNTSQVSWNQLWIVWDSMVGKVIQLVTTVWLIMSTVTAQTRLTHTWCLIHMRHLLMPWKTSSVKSTTSQSMMLMVVMTIN